MSAASEESRPLNEEIRRALARIELDREYGDFLKDRSVVIVGPAETLVGSEQGPSIDSFDVVVRFNTAIRYIPFSAELARDVGTRTDVLYCNNEVTTELILHEKGLTHEKFKSACREAGMRYLVSTNNDFTFASSSERESSSRAEAQAFDDFLKQQEIDIRFRMLYSTSAVAEELLRGYIGRTGFLAILDLLAYEVRRLSILGMTFYHSGGHLFLEDSVQKLHPLKNHLGLLPPDDIKGHNSYLELDVMRKLAELYPTKLDLDEQVQALLRKPILHV